MQSAHILRRQYLNLVDAFSVISGIKSILTKPAIRPVFPNPVTYDEGRSFFQNSNIKLNN